MFRRCVFASMVLFFGVFVVRAMALPEPVVYYTFDELEDPEDASGNGNDGTLKGDVQLNDDGKVGKCFAFNGVDSYVELENVSNESFTHMCWIKTDAIAPGAGMQAYDGNGLIWADVGGPTNDFASAICGDAFAFFVGTPNQTIRSETDVTTGEWIHVASTRDTTTGVAAVYINGVMEASMDHTNANPLTSNPIIAIGSNPLDNRYYTGLIDEVRLFNAVLTEVEIQEAMSVSPAAVDSAGKLTVTWGKMKSMF